MLATQQTLGADARLGVVAGRMALAGLALPLHAARMLPARRAALQARATAQAPQLEQLMVSLRSRTLEDPLTLRSARQGMHSPSGSEDEDEDGGDDNELPAPKAGRSAAADGIPEHERSRREKISKANKGRVPWNKGVAWTEESRAKISRRTMEAMQRPEVKARMAKANQHRPPQREEVKIRIRAVLRERATAAKELFSAAAVDIVAQMRASEDPAMRALVENEERALAAINSQAWRLIKRDWDCAVQFWETDHNGFRTLSLRRIKETAARDAARAETRATAQRAKRKTSVGKVRSAVATQKKLDLARGKLQQAEAALAKLQQAKVALAADPARLQLTLDAEAKFCVVLERLRDNVAALTKAMAPLQEYVAPSTAAADFVNQQREAAGATDP